jgi:hypothetical protein
LFLILFLPRNILPYCSSWTVLFPKQQRWLVDYWSSFHPILFFRPRIMPDLPLAG